MSRSPGDVFRVDLKAGGKKVATKELLFGVLSQFGIPSEEIIREDTGSKGKIYFFLKSLREAKAFAKRIENSPLKGVSVRISLIKKEDWQDKWKRSLKPFKITSRITVVPDLPGKRKKRVPERTIYLNIGMAFGSGLHPTTKYIAGFISSKKKYLKEFFDIGAGTGILAMVAAKCGAEKVWCIDSDKDAVRIAGDNFARNSCCVDHLEAVDLKDLKIRRRFDFVAANLQTHILLDMKKKILPRVKRGGYLAVSGISRGNYHMFRDRFDDKAFRCVKTELGKEWCAILYRNAGI